MKTGVKNRAIIVFLLSTALVLFLAGTTCGQEIIWAKTYGGWEDDGGCGVCQTSDGGYIVTGRTHSFGFGRQVYLLKTNAQGDTLWTKTYGGDGWEQGNSVQQVSDGGYIVAGWTTSFGSAYQVYLIKTDSDGDTLWTRTYGGSDWDEGISVQQTSDGGYIVGGATHSYGAGDWDVYLIKTDSKGWIEWDRTYGGIHEDRGSWVEQTSDGGYVVCGHTRSFGMAVYNVYLVKTDSRGDTLWTRAYYPWYSYWNMGFCCQQTQDGGYVVSGYSIDQSTGDGRAYLIKTDAHGDTIWTRTYDGGDLVCANSVRQTWDGDYMIVGFAQTSGSGLGNDIYMIKTDEEGDTLWTKIFGGSSGDVATDVAQTSDGSYIVVGSTGSYGAGISDVYLLKVSAFREATVICGDANGDGVVNGADVVYLVNYLFGNGPAPEVPQESDTNCDDIINLEDLIYLASYLFVGGPEPACECS